MRLVVVSWQGFLISRQNMWFKAHELIAPLRATQITRITSDFKLDEIKSENKAPSRVLCKTASNIICEEKAYLIFSLWPRSFSKEMTWISTDLHSLEGSFSTCTKRMTWDIPENYSICDTWQFMYLRWTLFWYFVVVEVLSVFTVLQLVCCYPLVVGIPSLCCYTC